MITFYQRSEYSGKTNQDKSEFVKKYKILSTKGLKVYILWSGVSD